MQNQNKNLERFFNPSSVAIVGATDGLGKVGSVITRNILNLGYIGNVFLVNPKRNELYKHKCYAKIEDIPDEVDLAIIVIPAELVNEVIKNASDKVKNFIVISAGFSESGRSGKSRESELARIAREKNLTILGPNCLGYILPKLRLNATFSGDLPRRGNIALVSQSGALAVAIMDIFKHEDLGFSGVFSIGNKMQIDETDLIEYLGKDDETKVIGIYLESIKYGSKFVETASRVSKLKPIIILKAGKSEKSQKAISSHTGALAGSKEITSAVFEKCGVIEAENSEEFVNLLKLISQTNPPVNERVVVITNAGGAGVLSTDEFSDKNIKLLEFSEGEKLKIKSFLPQAASVNNPVDVLGDAQEDRYQKVLEAVSQSNAGSIIVLLTPQEQTPVEKIAQEVVEFKKNSKVLLAASLMGGGKVAKAISLLEDNCIPNFNFPEQAIKALDAYYQWNLSRNTKKGIKTTFFNYQRKVAVSHLLKKILSTGKKTLLFPEGVKLLEFYNIKSVKFWQSAYASDIKFPVVVKADSDKILHKTEKRGVILGIKSRNELERAVHQIKNNFPEANLIIQPVSEGHAELILGIKHDKIFGPIIVFGLGGIYTEIFKLVNFAVPPLSFQEAEEKIKQSHLKFLFEKTRGLKAYNETELAEILVSLSELALENPEISELDINPLFIYNDGRQAISADIKVILK